MYKLVMMALLISVSLTAVAHPREITDSSCKALAREAQINVDMRKGGAKYADRLRRLVYDYESSSDQDRAIFLDMIPFIMEGVREYYYYELDDTPGYVETIRQQCMDLRGSTTS